MAKWRAKALELLPELCGKIQRSHTPMTLWIDIRMRFLDAYEEPGNDDFIRRVYAFADWCLIQNLVDDVGKDIPTSAIVCFYEHIPRARLHVRTCRAG